LTASRKVDPLMSGATWVDAECVAASLDRRAVDRHRRAVDYRTAWPSLASATAIPASALAVAATRPAARPALTFLQLLLGPANAALSSLLLLGIFDPADELVAGQGRNVLPGSECRRVGNQRLAEVYG
jgi:hypothetical protein